GQDAEPVQGDARGDPLRQPARPAGRGDPDGPAAVVVLARGPRPGAHLPPRSGRPGAVLPAGRHRGGDRDPSAPVGRREEVTVTPLPDPDMTTRLPLLLIALAGLTPRATAAELTALTV